MTPTSLSILLAALPAERRIGGVRLWAATGAIAAAIGPSVGGVLTQFGWQWVFLINLPVGAALLVVALREVHEARPDDECRCARPARGRALRRFGRPACTRPGEESGMGLDERTHRPGAGAVPDAGSPLRAAVDAAPLPGDPSRAAACHAPSGGRSSR